MNWINMPLDEFIQIPYDNLNVGCHITPDRLMCWDILPTNALYKAFDFTVPVQLASVTKDVESILLGVIYLMVLYYVSTEWI